MITTTSLTQWPDGREHAVLITVNYEDIEYLLAQDPEGHHRQKSQSVFQYGSHRGVHALLDAFAAERINTTWFMPGRLATNQSSLLAEIHAAGHELAVSGYAYEQLDTLSQREQSEVLRRSRDAIAEITGFPPAGFRLQRGDWPHGLTALLAEVGFRWSSSLIGEDLPFLLPTGSGRPLVELPRNYTCNDRLAFFWNFSPPFPPGQTRIGHYAGTLQNWLFELRGAEQERLCTILELHPEIIGTPGRRGLVDELLASEPMRSRAWIATGSELAAWWQQQHVDNPPSHPVEVMLAATRSTAF